MRLILKLNLLFFAFFFSFSSFAGSYVSIFKPQKQIKTLSEFKEDIKKDVLQLRSIMNLKDVENKSQSDQNSLEVVRYKKASHTSDKNPIEI